jgi:hypothetical protein
MNIKNLLSANLLRTAARSDPSTELITPSKEGTYQMLTLVFTDASS